MDVETDIAENLLSRVALGQPAEVSVSAVPSKRYRGRLRQIIPMGDRTRGTVKVKVEILDPDEKLFPELVATVHFLPDKTGDSPDASRSFLFVPKSAVFEENGHDYVWVVGKKSHGPQAAGRGGDDHGRPGARRVGPRSRASPSSSTRSKTLTRQRRPSGSPNNRRRRRRPFAETERLPFMGEMPSIVLRGVDKEYRRDEFRDPGPGRTSTSRSTRASSWP